MAAKMRHVINIESIPVSPKGLKYLKVYLLDDYKVLIVVFRRSWIITEENEHFITYHNNCLHFVIKNTGTLIYCMSNNKQFSPGTYLRCFIL